MSGRKLRLRDDVMLRCVPFEGEPGTEKDLRHILPEDCCLKNLLGCLSSLQWDRDHVGEQGPRFDVQGRINVRKVYFDVTGSARRSFISESEGAFGQFVTWYGQLPANAVVTLVLWHDLTRSARSSRKDQASKIPRQGVYSGGVLEPDSRAVTCVIFSCDSAIFVLCGMCGIVLFRYNPCRCFQTAVYEC